MNLLLWTTHVTSDFCPTLAKLKAAGFDGVEVPVFEGDEAHYKTIRKELQNLAGRIDALLNSPDELELYLFANGSAAADRGLQKEFEAIIAAVIGGTLLTGGYGSVVGATFGALIFGVVQIGITYTNVNSDWFRVFLGGMLLVAVLFNNQVRKRVTEAR